MSTVGPTIPTGTQGSTGPQGNTGARGYTGSQGVAGNTGSTGMQGNQGKTGSQGSTGLQGNQGSTGVGTVGATGLQGSQGSQGPAGTGGSGTGITGSQGVQGATGSVGADGTYSMTCAPPAILFSAVTATSKYIYIPWTYPTQIVAGSLGCYLPLITSVTCDWSLIVNGTTLVNNQPILSTATGNTNVQYNGTIPYTTWITGLVLTNVSSAASPPYQSLMFPGETVARNCYVYYSSNFANMTSTSTNTVTAYYSNYNTDHNSATQGFSIFLSAGVPSAPLAPSFTSTASQTVSSTTISGTTTNNTTYGTGTNYIDLGSTGSNTYAAANYKYTYSTPGSTSRSGGQVGHTGSQTGSSGTQTITSLYPDSVYSLDESVQNNSTNTSYSAISSVYQFTSANLAPTQSFGSITFPGITTTSVKLVAANGSGDLINAPVSVIFGSPAPLTSNGFISPIHYAASRGLLTANGTKLLDISCNVVRGGNSVDVGGTVLYNGFPVATPTTLTTTGLIITPSAPTDSFTASASQFQGFYLQTGSNTVTLKSSIFTATNDKTTVNLNQIQYQKNGSTSYATSNSSFSFYYDIAPSTTPSIGTFASTLKTVTTFSVSGITAFYGSIVFNATTPTSNIGNYYYRNGNIVSYNVGGSVVANETSLANISTVTSPLATSNTFTNIGSPAISYTPSLFATSIAIYAVAYNCVGTASINSNTVTFTAIFDPSSYTLLNNTAQYPIAYTSGNAYTGSGQGAKPGLRIVSGQTNGAIYSNDSQPFVSALPAAAIYANSSYDNTQDITSSTYNYDQELQMVNGLYVTKGYTGATRYVNYSTYLNNSANYSGISGGVSAYRYATFAWKCAPNASNYSKITFAINGLTQTITTPATIPQSGSSTIEMFYRIEDAANPSTSSSNFSAAYRNTTWLNVYGQGATPVLSANYHLQPNIYSGQNTALTNTFSSNTLTTYVLTPSFAVGSSDNVYIYLRVGLPMSINLGFSYVTATLT